MVPNNGSRANGMKIASGLLRYQLLTQCLPGVDHQGAALGPPLLDARLHTMGACMVNTRRHYASLELFMPAE
jgi:hypothetical protein